MKSSSAQSFQLHKIAYFHLTLFPIEISSSLLIDFWWKGIFIFKKTAKTTNEIVKKTSLLRSFGIEWNLFNNRVQN